MGREAVFQVHPIRDDDHPAVLKLRLQLERLGQKDHGEGLARTRGVPDDIAFTTATSVQAFHPLKHGHDPERLRIDTLPRSSRPACRDDEVPDYLQQTFLSEQTDQQLVLICGKHILGPERLEVSPH